MSAISILIRRSTVSLSRGLVSHYYYSPVFNRNSCRFNSSTSNTTLTPAGQYIPEPPVPGQTVSSAHTSLVHLPHVGENASYELEHELLKSHHQRRQAVREANGGNTAPDLFAPDQLNALGEPTIASLGLGSYYSPWGLFQNLFEGIHVHLHLPWLACISTTALIVRLTLFPFLVRQQQRNAELARIMPILQEIQGKLAEIKATRNITKMSTAFQPHHIAAVEEYKRVGGIFRNLKVPIIQMPFVVTIFVAIRQMANLPVPSFKTAGILWFPDLTVADPFYVLPIATSVLFWLSLELGSEGMASSALPGNRGKYLARIVPIAMFPFMVMFPSALCWYWASSTALGLAQLGVMRIPAVRKTFGLADRVDKSKAVAAAVTASSPLAVQPPADAESWSIKKWWHGMKGKRDRDRALRDSENQGRSDYENFVRAGQGKIPRTFDHNPKEKSRIVQ